MFGKSDLVDNLSGDLSRARNKRDALASDIITLAAEIAVLEASLLTENDWRERERAASEIERIKKQVNGQYLAFVPSIAGFRGASEIAKIESDFDPKQRTGSYFGLFQLSKDEFAQYGSGDILDARDNAVAAAYKFATAAMLFELSTHKKATFSDLYLIHQQGTRGAEEHVNHPDRIAWKSMCATDEGKEKGEKWCKRAIWENTLPEVKHVWKSVDNLTSSVFVQMWQDQVKRFYTRYSEATTN